jgi:hypothetical protein
MRAQIKEKREVAKGTLLVTFDLLGREVDFEPGQYFFVTLPDVGHQDEKGLRRHITVVTSPNERGVLLHGERGRGHARRLISPVRAPLALAGRAAARTGAERVSENALLGGVRRLAPRPN